MLFSWENLRTFYGDFNHSYVSHYQRVCLLDFMPPTWVKAIGRPFDLCVSCAFLIGLIGCTTQLGLYYWLYPPMKNGWGILWEHMEFCSWENQDVWPMGNHWQTQRTGCRFLYISWWIFHPRDRSLQWTMDARLAMTKSLGLGGFNWFNCGDPSQMIHLKGVWAQLSPSYPTNCSIVAIK